MVEKSGFEYFEVQFTKSGDVHDRDEVTALKKHLAASDTTDLLVLSHGWNNDMGEARGLYEGLLSRLRTELEARRITGAPASITVLGLLWPSKKFADMELTAGGAAGLASSVTDDALFQQIQQLEQLLDDPGQTKRIEDLKALVPRLEDSPKAQREFADLLRAALAPEAGVPDGVKEGEPEDASDTFFSLSGSELMDRLAKPVESDVEPAEAEPVEAEPNGFDGIGGATRLGGDDVGSAAGFGDFLSGIKAGASNLLNYATFYSMKQRAGTVGQRGVNTLLREIAKDHHDLRIHLVGHSFGGRLVTAATAGPSEGSALAPHSLVLLQAAFSHNGFGENFDGKGGNGGFRRVVSAGLVHGPIVITHTRNDKAVGLAYPLASLISGSDSAGLGDENDRFGGMGRNGAQFTPEAEMDKLGAVDDTYELHRGRVYNLRADSVISGHSDILGPEVAHVLLAAIAAG
ncbi:MAG: hypothetical protein ABIW36_03375 [Terrimesophilobacter sp.]